MTSESLRIFLLRNKTISAFYNSDPTSTTDTKSTSSETETLQRYLGNLNKCTSFAVPCFAGPIRNLIITSDNPLYSPPVPYNNYNFYVNISWDSVPNATGYIITTDDTTTIPPTIVYTPGTTTATVYYNGVNSETNYVDTLITITAQTPCGTTSATTNAQPCFLAGSIVQMANNITKNIEDVQVGDRVVGAFGEINTVLALHRPLVGNALMCKINNEHSTTNHHPHISVDRKFYCGNPNMLNSMTYGLVHRVIDASGNTVDRLLKGLNPGRVQKLDLGIELKAIEGSRLVTSLETYNLSPDTQLYNLVIDGSHTYHVDGYAVTGWPSEDDFDYDSWTSKV